MFLLCNTMRNFLDKYQGKKISLWPNSIIRGILSLQLGLLPRSPCARKPTSAARNEMMKVATVQTYPYFSLMT